MKKYSIKNDYIDIELPKAIAIVPVKDLFVSEKYSIDRINIYPPNSVNLREINENKMDFTFEDYKEDFSNCTLIVFPIEHQRNNMIGALMPDQKNHILAKVLDRADDVISVFRYIYCNLDMSSNLPQQAGYIQGITTGILIFYPQMGNSDFIFEKHKVIATTIGKGMVIDIRYDKNVIDKFSVVLCDDCGEIGNIIKNSLRLYSNIIYSINKTNKFILAMSLIEYLASPYKFIPMKKTKARILPFTTKNKKEYYMLCDRFTELTGKNIDGIEYGLRTNVVHNGKTIDELVEDKYEVDFILRELQKYICNVINEVVVMYKNDWSYVTTEVNLRLKEIENNKDDDLKAKMIMDVLFFVDFRFLNNSIKEVYQLYPQFLDKKINIPSLLYIIAKQVNIKRNGYTIPVQIVYEKDEEIFNCDSPLSISKLENMGFDSDLGQFDIYASKANIEYDAYMENLLTHYFYEMNINLNEISKFNTIVLISDRNKINKKIFQDVANSCKKLYVGRLDNYRTTMDFDCSWFDIQYLIMNILGIELWKECVKDYIYNIPQ